MGILQSQRIYDIQEENTTLRADNARLTAELATANERIAALEAERDGARADAEMYRNQVADNEASTELRVLCAEAGEAFGATIGAMGYCGRGEWAMAWANRLRAAARAGKAGE